MKPIRSALLSLATAAALSAGPSPDQPVPDRLDLPGALGFAVENNFTIRTARSRVSQAEGSLVTARAGYLPHAGV